jgi:hypothetical protein
MNGDENEVDPAEIDGIEPLDDIDIENHRPPKKIGETVDRLAIYDRILQERPDLDITQPRNP